jgi:hypothetical protein
MALRACGNFDLLTYMLRSQQPHRIELYLFPSVGCSSGGPVFLLAALQCYHWRSQDEGFG